MFQIQLPALALAATVLVASGCGGSSKTGSTTTVAATATTATASTSTTTATAITVATGKPLTRTKWIAEGDAICTRANEKLNSAIARTEQDLARLLPQAAAYERIEATELSKLVSPTAVTSDWRQIITDLQKFSELSAKAGEYARVDNFKAARPIAIAGNTVQRQLIAIAKRDGFKVCSLP